MSKHNGNISNGGTNPRPAQTVVETVVVQAPTLSVVNSLEELIAQAGKSGMVLSPEAMQALEKLKGAESELGKITEQMEAPKRLGEAEADITANLPKWLETIASAHKVSFSGRKLTIVFKTTPKEGEPNPLVSFGPETEVVASKKGGGGGRKGSTKSEGTVEMTSPDGTVSFFDSRGKLASSYGVDANGKALWKMEGRHDASVAITNPCSQAEWEALDSEGRKNLPAKYRIESAVNPDGKQVCKVSPITVPV